MLTAVFLGVYGSISFFTMISMYKKDEQANLEFDRKLKDKGYKKTDENADVFSLVASEIIDSRENLKRKFLSFFPIVNLYPFFQIINKKLDKEYERVLKVINYKGVLDVLEDYNYIYKQDTIQKRKEILNNKIDEMNKTDEPNENINECLKVSVNDSLNRLKQKKLLINEMIYLKNLEKMDQDPLYQTYEEEPTEKGKQLIRQFGQIKNRDYLV